MKVGDTLCRISCVLGITNTLNSDDDYGYRSKTPLNTPRETLEELQNEQNDLINSDFFSDIIDNKE